MASSSYRGDFSHSVPVEISYGTLITLDLEKFFSSVGGYPLVRAVPCETSFVRLEEGLC